MSDSMKILLVDDDADFLDAQKLILEEAGFSVTTAENGKEAMNILASKEFSLVISDLNMPEVGGAELIEWISSNKSGIKTLLTTAFGQSQEATDAMGRGATALLPKPFNEDSLLQIVRENTPTKGSPYEEVNFNEKDYARISLDHFIYGKKVSFPVYIRLSENKFLKLVHTGTELDLKKLLALRNKGLREIWLKNDDFQKYSEVVNQMADKVFQRPLAASEPSQILMHTCEVAMENLRRLDIEKTSIVQAKATVERSINTVLNHSGSVDLVRRMALGSESLFAHSASRAFLCGLLTQVMSWSSPKNINTIIVAAYFLDVGLFTLPLEFQIPDPARLPEEKKGLYRRHPLLGAEILRRIPSISPKVITIVLEHHENGKGTGYPKGLKKSAIFPMTKLVSFVDRFLTQVLTDRPEGMEEMNKVISYTFSQDPGMVEQNYEQALKVLIRSPNLEKAKSTYNNLSKGVYFKAS